MGMDIVLESALTIRYVEEEGRDKSVQGSGMGRVDCDRVERGLA
jgi:hypothetical protein